MLSDRFFAPVLLQKYVTYGFYQIELKHIKNLTDKSCIATYYRPRIFGQAYKTGINDITFYLIFVENIFCNTMLYMILA